MPTNDERRKVAAEMREYPAELTATLHPAEEALAYYVLDLMSIVGLEYGQVMGFFARLADLIEPEERTCRNTAGKPFAGYRMFNCSVCGAYLEVDGDTDANLLAGGERPMPRYCPNCGARVIQE